VLGIEAVEWFAEGGENLTVRVTGRWRRRRPAWSGQPVLVIESSGRRHRFPAMPEPPSLTGAGPGTWRLSFAVPAVLAPELSGRAWLQFGAVVVQLPAAVEPYGAGGEGEAEQVDPATSQSSGGPMLSPELEIEGLRRRAREAEEAAAQLTERVRVVESELGAARLRAERLSASLTERDTARRTAEQRAHAEQALRRDLSRQLAARAAESERAREALGDLAAAEERIRELESELGDVRRRGDEAEQLAAAAVAARERVERQAREAQPQLARGSEGPSSGEEERLRFERGLVTRRAAAGRRIPSEPVALSRSPSGGAPSPGDPAVAPAPGDSGVPPSPGDSSVPPSPGDPAATPSPGDPAEPAVPGPTPVRTGAGTSSLEVTASGQDALIGALRRELEVRVGAETMLRSRLVEAEGRLASRPLLHRRTEATLGLLRRELDGLRSAFERERADRIAAELRVAELSRDARVRQERSRQTYEAISELREALDKLRTAPRPGAPSSEAGGANRVQPDRFNAARVRLRETIAPPEPEPPAEPPPELAQEPEPAAEPPPELAQEPPGPEPEPAREPPGPEPEPAAEPSLDLPQELSGPEPEPPGPQAPEPANPAPVQRTTRAWLAPVIRAMARSDAAGAGRLLLELLPAQQEVFPDPVAYDLVLGDSGPCIRVTARGHQTTVRRAPGPRPPGEVDFQIFGTPAAIVTLLTAGPLRRLLRRGVARVRGRRDRVAALRSLVDLRLDLADLHRAGVRLGPELTLKVLALAIEPAWTERERFTLACSPQGGDTAYLLVRDGQRPVVSDEAPGGRLATTISGPPRALAAGLSGRPSDQLIVTGEEWPLALLSKWLKRAQSD